MDFDDLDVHRPGAVRLFDSGDALRFLAEQVRDLCPRALDHGRDVGTRRTLLRLVGFAAVACLFSLLALLVRALTGGLVARRRIAVVLGLARGTAAIFGLLVLRGLFRVFVLVVRSATTVEQCFCRPGEPAGDRRGRRLSGCPLRHLSRVRATPAAAGRGLVQLFEGLRERGPTSLSRLGAFALRLSTLGLCHHQSPFAVKRLRSSSSRRSNSSAEISPRSYRASASSSSCSTRAGSFISRSASSSSRSATHIVPRTGASGSVSRPVMSPIPFASGARVRGRESRRR